MNVWNEVLEWIRMDLVGRVWRGGIALAISIVSGVSALGGNGTLTFQTRQRMEHCGGYHSFHKYIFFCDRSIARSAQTT